MDYVKKILVAEDDESIRKLIDRSLSISGIEADFAEDGKIALDRIDALSGKNLSYPIVSTDLSMPNLDGIRLIEEIGERVGSEKILRPQIYVFSGGHPREGEIPTLDIYNLIEQNYKKPFGIIEFARKIRETYDAIKTQ